MKSDCKLQSFLFFCMILNETIGRILKYYYTIYKNALEGHLFIDIYKIKFIKHIDTSSQKSQPH
jgi:hypothetical protein